MATTNETRTNLREIQVNSNLNDDENTKFIKHKNLLQIGINFCFIFLVVGSIIEKSDQSGKEAAILAYISLIFCLLSLMLSIFWTQYGIGKLSYLLLIIKHSSVLGSIAISLERGINDERKNQNYYILCFSMISSELQLFWENMKYQQKMRSISKTKSQNKGLFWGAFIIYQIISQVASLHYTFRSLIQVLISISFMLLLFLAEKQNNPKKSSQSSFLHSDEVEGKQYEIKNDNSFYSDQYIHVLPSQINRRISKSKTPSLVQTFDDHVTNNKNYQISENGIVFKDVSQNIISSQQPERINFITKTSKSSPHKRSSHDFQKGKHAPLNQNTLNTTSLVSHLPNIPESCHNLNNNNIIQPGSNQQINQNINSNHQILQTPSNQQTYFNTITTSENYNPKPNLVQLSNLIKQRKNNTPDEGSCYISSTGNNFNGMGFSNMGFLKPTQSRLIKKSSLTIQDKNQKASNLSIFLPYLPFTYIIFSFQDKEISIIENNIADFSLNFMEELLIDDLNMPLSLFVKMRFDPKYKDATSLHKNYYMCTHSNTQNVFKMLISIGSDSLIDSALPSTVNSKIPSLNFTNALTCSRQKSFVNSKNLLALFFFEVTEIITQNVSLLPKVGEENALTEYKQDLLASVSHDLKNLLNGMIQVLDLCNEEWQESKETIKNSKLENLINLAQKSSQLLLFLVYDIQDFHLHQKRKLRLRSEEVNIEQLLQELQGLFHQQVIVKGIQLKVKSFSDKQCLYTDGLRLKQVLINLVSNAVKYTKKGEVSITLREEAQSGLVKFEIQDTGSGIPDNILKQLFQVYSTFDHQSGQNLRGKRLIIIGNDILKFKGVGLGLVISQKIVEAMGPSGQQIQIISEQGKGTTFSFIIFEKLYEKNLIHDHKNSLWRSQFNHFSISMETERQISLANNSQAQMKTSSHVSPFNYANYNNNNLKLLGIPIYQFKSDSNQSDPDLLVSRKNSHQLEENLEKNKSLIQFPNDFSSLRKSSRKEKYELNQEMINNLDDSIEIPSSSRASLSLSENQNQQQSCRRIHKQTSIPFQKCGEKKRSLSKVERQNQSVSKSIDFDDRELNQGNDQLQINYGISQRSLPIDEFNNTKNHLHRKKQSILKNRLSLRKGNEGDFFKEESYYAFNNNLQQSSNLQSQRYQQSLNESSFDLRNSSNMQKILKFNGQSRNGSFFINNHMTNSLNLQNISKIKTNEEFAQQLLSFGIKQIMIVDDEPMNIFVMTETLRFLEKYGISFLAAHSGEQAIEEAEKQKDLFQLLFIDQNMPGVSGIEALQRIKKMNPDLIAIIVSGDSRHEDLTLAEQGGANGFLSKPTQLKHIKQILSNIRRVKMKQNYCKNEINLSL